MFGNQAAQRMRHLLLFLLAVALIAVSAPALYPQGARMGWSIGNATSSVDLAEVKESGGATTVVLKNSSDKVITAVAVTYGDTTRTIEYFQSHQSLSPGASCSIRVGTQELRRSDRVLRLAAVIFENGTWEGNQERVHFIAGKRLGRVMEMERVKGILEPLAEGDLGSSEIEAAKAAIGDLPRSSGEALDSVSGVRLPGLETSSIRTADESIRRGVRIGIRGAREEALIAMDRLRDIPRTLNNTVQTPRERVLSRTGFLSRMRESYRALSMQNHRILGQTSALLPVQREVKERSQENG